MATNLLIVDDSRMMRVMIRRTLDMSQLQYDRIYEAENGIEALARMGEVEINCVVLDINMPLMNGLQLVRRMRDDARLSAIPVLVASTEGSDERIAELKQYGVVGFVRKPFSPEQIHALLEPILGAQPATANSDHDSGMDF